MSQHVYQANSRNSATFTGRYACCYLVYFEEHRYIPEAIKREKQIKGWTRARKKALIETINPGICFLDAG
ncbi:hypothetical protein B0I18_104284 [Taibaiella chishuiensis]|uniref:GIY-YIG domain-containing protein n=2 Tax=Taibaiella chishuiensis TaxID=1434707 RepID=A0A2P8D4N8_9BACT|nr:hypothetical protein B0I18_104284 [Taibaiella chishuiensis]